MDTGDIQSICITSCITEADLMEDTPLKPSVLSATKSILLQCVSTLLFLPLSLAFLYTALYYWFDHLGASTYSITMEEVLHIFHCYYD